MKRKNKKVLALFLAAAIILGMTSCGGNKTESSADTTVPLSTTSEETGTKASEAAPTEPKEEDMTFYAGFGRADITPMDSVPMVGYGNDEKRKSTGFLDPIYANCVALRDGNGETVILVMLDLVGMWESQVANAKTGVINATGIPEDHVYIAVTHDHGAPGLTATLPVRYRNYVTSQMGNAAAEALADLKPCTASIGSAEVLGLNFVRHYLMKDGSYAGDNFGNMVKTDIVQHETEADHTARFLRFEREGAKDILVVNFQVHPHRTGGMNKTEVSADIVGSIRNYIEEKEDVYCAYMQGGAGNINPTSYVDSENLTTDYKAYGKCFWDQAEKALSEMEPVKLGAIKVTGHVTYEGTVDHSMDGVIKVASEIYTEFTKTGDRAKSVRDGEPYGIHSCYHAEAIIAKASEGKTLSMELNAVAFGEIGLFTAPYEMFDENANYVRENSPYKLTLAMAYCNGMRSYIPSQTSFNNGCYEADQCRFVPGTGEMLAEKFAEMLTDLSKQPTPTEKKSELIPKEKPENDLEGLTCDGKVYYNFNRSVYDGTDATHTRKTTDAGTAFELTVLNPQGAIETLWVIGKGQILKSDGLDCLCLWKDSAGLIKAVSSPVEAGLQFAAQKLYVKSYDKRTGILNTAPSFLGQESKLTIPEGINFLLVPEKGATAVTQKATMLLPSDRVTAIADGNGKLVTVFVFDRKGAEARNLAKGCKVTTTYGDLFTDSTRTKLSAPIEQAVDGNSSPSYSTAAHYKWSEDGYILFDLGAEHTLTGYRIYNYEYPFEWCINQAWTVYGSLDGENWTELAKDSIDVTPFTGPVLYYSNIKGGKPDGSDFAQPFQGRYVKLVVDKVFVGAGAAAGSTVEACSRPDVRMYEFEILGS